MNLDDLISRLTSNIHIEVGPELAGKVLNGWQLAILINKVNREAIDIEMGDATETSNPDEPIFLDPSYTKEDVLAALDGSIQKWVGIVDGTMADQGPDNCPLCQMFWYDACRGCPVAEDTMELQCGGTPYDEWTELRDKLKHNIGVADTPELKVAATNMLNYIVNLKKKLS